MKKAVIFVCCVLGVSRFVLFIFFLVFAIRQTSYFAKKRVFEGIQCLYTWFKIYYDDLTYKRHQKSTKTELIENQKQCVCFC